VAPEPLKGTLDFAELARGSSQPATVTGLRDLARDASIRRIELILLVASFVLSAVIVSGASGVFVPGSGK
jgi:hypothetical protein